MKTAVSVPDDVFREAEQLAKRLKTSRSRLYSDALREYVARHSPEDVTAAYDRLIEECGQPSDDAVLAANARTLTRVEW